MLWFGDLLRCPTVKLTYAKIQEKRRMEEVFFCFPHVEKEPARLERWLHNMGTKNTKTFKWSKHKTVCSDHFHPIYNIAVYITGLTFLIDEIKLIQSKVTNVTSPLILLRYWFPMRYTLIRALQNWPIFLCLWSN